MSFDTLQVLKWVVEDIMPLLVPVVHKDMVLIGVMETVFGPIISALKQEVWNTSSNSDTMYLIKKYFAWSSKW